ncbi:MAG: hypothetical protein JSV24_04225 [Bacteroidales bacterium]|nr:MAG: hypothetical protein JSV24_04225 [Bacteroidales bacterium]
MKKIQFVLLALATVCLIGLFACKSEGQEGEEETATETEAVEEAVDESMEEVPDTTVVDTSAVEEVE